MQSKHKHLGDLKFMQRIIIYPNYIDSTVTVAQGRVIPKDLGGCPPAHACVPTAPHAQVHTQHSQHFRIAQMPLYVPALPLHYLCML